MKRNCILLLTCLSLGTVWSGFMPGPTADEILLTADMVRTEKKKNAAYTCVLESQNENGFFYKVYFLTGELKMEGWYTAEDMTVPNGPFTYYYQNGQVESAGEFRDGVKFGLWTRYHQDGTPKPEKIYTSLQMLQAIGAETAP